LAKESKVKERICFVCRTKKPVDALIRIARIDGKYIIDHKGNSGGRGCHIDPNCIEKAIKNKALHKSFKGNVPQETYEALAKHMEKV